MNCSPIWWQINKSALGFFPHDRPPKIGVCADRKRARPTVQNVLTLDCSKCSGNYRLNSLRDPGTSLDLDIFQIFFAPGFPRQLHQKLAYLLGITQPKTSSGSPGSYTKRISPLRQSRKHILIGRVVAD
ncbi:MAG TPA: hypothetical protein VFR89_07315, partial [candidate division Zixibacteria bacterium]|nr:hypothetical protein [candidate division Zixibacteria bacterium]